MRLPDFQNIMVDPEEEWRRKMVSVPVDETIKLWRDTGGDNWQLPIVDGQVMGAKVINKWLDLFQGCQNYFEGISQADDFPRKCFNYLDEVCRNYPELTKEKIQASLRALKNLVGGDREKQEMLKTDPGVIKEIWRLCLVHAMLNPKSKAAEIFPETSFTAH